ncbi:MULTISPECIES: alcohol dehydrogenase family protein [Acinetobacter]|jgi:NADPH:quinone reductase-like Zn-dependent oxidoreductase|uniref:alcohol dehydrogenase family protein n=1 Tax=Acinetobacter TaxID=469 RepID=UPI002270FF06|nr:alcohol dehydrogenase family protein [Acinetobacter baumannii]MCY0272574.1 alcohol dehydrogenase family protein [Acinetobacter baumannii]
MVLPTKMHAVLLKGHGGLDQLEYRTDVTVPTPADDEVLIQVSAAGVNNTDINTRIGWYSKTNEQATNTGGANGLESISDDDASWSGTPLKFPFIQGADCCGKIVAVGKNVDPSRIGERVIVRTMLRAYVDYRPYECWTFGSECNGGFAQFATVKSAEAYKINSDWTDEELASIPCSYSTAENMLHRIGLGAETVLITGASGGVGSAAVQLAKRRGAQVIALCSLSKADEVLACGADRVIDRNADLVKELGKESIDVVIDLIGGPQWPSLLEVLRNGGRYANAGAIAGPISQIDLRTVYLNDLTLMGCTFQEDEVFTNLISYIEKNEIRPLVAKTYPLNEIAKAQEEFLSKKHLGKLVLTVPSVEA